MLQFHCHNPRPVVVRMTEINECKLQRFHITLLSSSVNDSYYSSNCVVIVTTNSHLAICVSLFGLCQPTFIQINPSLCSAVIACYFSLPDAPFFPTGFPNDAWLLSVCRVSHANPAQQSKAAHLCIWVMQVFECMFFFVCFFVSFCLSFMEMLLLTKTEQSEVKNNKLCQRLKLSVWFFFSQMRLWTALSL